MSNVVDLAGFQCPVGSLAMHPVHGLVEVFSQDGWMRGVVGALAGLRVGETVRIIGRNEQHERYGQRLRAARAALAGTANAGPYVASKMAVIRLTEAMADELGQQGINVNCVLPGRMDTPPNRAEQPDADFSKWVRPESMADVILFLASDLSSYMTGEVVSVSSQHP